MNGSGSVGVGETPWQHQQRLQWEHDEQLRQQRGGYAGYGGYPQPGFVPVVEQQYQQQLYPQGYAANAGVSPYPNYQYGGYGVPAAPVLPGRPAPPAPQPAPPAPGRPAPPANGRPAAPAAMNSWARWQQVHPGSSYQDYTNWYFQYGAGGGTINGLPSETGVGAMNVVGVGYPDHFHVGYDGNNAPIYKDRYGRHHYGHQTGYAPAYPPPDPSQYGVGQAPMAAPPGAPPAAAPAAAVVVVPPAAPAPWYGGVAAQLKLPHPAGAALISAIGAGVGAFAGLKLGPKLPARMHLDSVSAAAAGAAIGAGVAGGVAAMLIAKTAHDQHAMTTGTPAPA